jgi:hypothetical protein
MAGYETQVYRYSLETKQHLSQWESPSPSHPKATCVHVKVRACHMCFLPVMELCIMNLHQVIIFQVVFEGMLWYVCEGILWKHLEDWHSGNWLLLHDNAPACTTLSLWYCLARNDMPEVSWHEYSPDIVSYDFFMFPKIKTQWHFVVPATAAVPLCTYRVKGTGVSEMLPRLEDLLDWTALTLKVTSSNKTWLNRQYVTYIAYETIEHDKKWQYHMRLDGTCCSYCS